MTGRGQAGGRGDAGHQRNQRQITAAVQGDVADLLPGERRGTFARFGLQLQALSGDFDGLTDLADLQADGRSGQILVGLQRQVFVSEALKPGASTRRV